MGFKDWFTSRPGPLTEADSVWLDNGARLAGLAQLGVSANEEMTHPMISAAIERPQKKLAEQSTEEVRADSAEDWLDTIGPVEPR